MRCVKQRKAEEGSENLVYSYLLGLARNISPFVFYPLYVEVVQVARRFANQLRIQSSPLRTCYLDQFQDSYTNWLALDLYFAQSIQLPLSGIKAQPWLSWETPKLRSITPIRLSKHVRLDRPSHLFT